MSDTKTRVEEFKVEGSEVKERVKKLIKEANVRRISIKNKDGDTVLEIPVTVGVIGALIAPVLAAVGAAAALLSECTISVEREVEES